MEITLEIKREARLIFEIRTRELENNIQRYEDTLAREMLRTKESGRTCICLDFQLEQANLRIQERKSMDQDGAYMLLSNKCRYWRNLYRDIEVTKAEDLVIIQDLQGLYV